MAVAAVSSTAVFDTGGGFRADAVFGAFAVLSAGRVFGAERLLGADDALGAAGVLGLLGVRVTIENLHRDWVQPFDPPRRSGFALDGQAGCFQIADATFRLQRPGHPKPSRKAVRRLSASSYSVERRRLMGCGAGNRHR
ncbi:MAG TPA: hypothetical protein VF959_00450 [Casimicrobiaceae bacterium]